MDKIERIHQSFASRIVEENDTRDAIQRHDPDYHKRHNQSKNQNTDDGEDLTNISVESLIVFLTGLKKDAATPQMSPTDLNKQSHAPIDETHKQAMKAYQGGDTHHTKQQFTYLDHDDDNHSIDRDQIDTLIHHLESLLGKGIQTIDLLPADGFLESIEKTVEKYLSL